jgi:hypothetical protein
MATGFGLNGQGLIPGRGKIFLFSIMSGQLWGPPGLLSNGYWEGGAVSLGVKQQGCEADHTPAPSTKVKNSGAIPSLPHTSSLHNA